MPEQFLHGVEVVEITDGLRPITSVRSSVIGIIGTAPEADAAKFPLNTPVLLSGRPPASADIGEEGTLPNALDGIFDQAGATVVVIRIEEGNNPNDLATHVIGSAADKTGVHAFRKSQGLVFQTPRVLVAPGLCNLTGVVAELLVVAEKLRAVIVADATTENGTASQAKTFASTNASRRVYCVYPWVKVVRAGVEVNEPSSARVAGLIAKTDFEKGFWWSPSNQNILGITGTSVPVEFSLNDPSSESNDLNENRVACVVAQDGFRLWGNRTTSADSKWSFLQTVRTADIIGDSLVRAHLWAVDRNITKTYISDVTNGVNSYLNDLKAEGAILGGTCWADPDLNTASAIAQGKVYFNFDFTPPYPAEHITFRSFLTENYLQDIV